MRRLLAVLLVLAAPALAEEVPLETGRGPAGRPRLEGSLSVDQAVAVAASQSLRVELSADEVEMLQARADEAGSEAGLKLSVGTYLTFNDFGMIYSGAPGVRPSFLARVPDENALDTNAMAMLPLFTGGKLSSRIAAASEAERAGVARQAFTLLDVVRQTRRAYYAVLLALAEEEAARREVVDQEEAAGLVRAQLEAGRVARYVLLRAEAEAARARQDLNRAVAARTGAEALLKATMGVAVTSDFEYAGAFEPPPDPGDPEALFAEALSLRPDLVAARHGVREGELRIEEIGAEYSPQAYLVGMYERLQRSPFRGGPAEDGFSGGLVLSWSLYDSGERDAKVRQAEAERSARRHRLEEMELEVTRQVATALAELAAGRQDMELAREEIEKAEEDLRLARLRFEVGRGIHLELLDATAAAARARRNAAAAGYRANTAWADLLHALGRVEPPRETGPLKRPPPGGPPGREASLP